MFLVKIKVNFYKLLFMHYEKLKLNLNKKTLK